MKKKILITGGAGFVGSNLAIYLKKRLKGVQIICLDNLKRNGSPLNAQRLKDHNIQFVKGDIRNKKDLFACRDIGCLIECSAEPSVLAAYDNPVYTIDTNLQGTIHCLELARREKADFVFLSTSRVYPIEPLEKIPFKELATRFDWLSHNKGLGFTYRGIAEDFPLEGVRSLYGATKLSSELLIREYMDMFSLRGFIDRFGIIAGPWQMGKIDQGLVGFWIIQHFFKNKLNYIGFGGKGKQVRDVIHIDDVCEIIFLQLQHLKKNNGQTFNIGGGRKNSFSLLELTWCIQDVLKIRIPVSSVPSSRKSDVRIYISDNEKINKHMSWRPKKSLEDIVIDIAQWLSHYEKQLIKVLE